MSGSAESGRPWLAAAAAVLLHLGALGAGFVYDDQTYVQTDPAVVGDAPVFASATPPDRPELGLYRPLTTLTHRWTFRSFGLDPLPFHAVNLSLHGLCAALVVLLARRLGLSGAAQTFAGLLFAAHPVHVEAVAWITGRAELLAAAFALFALLAYGRADDPHPRRRAALAAVLYLGAGLAKESALPLPAAFLLLDWIDRPRTRAGMAEIWMRLLPVAVVAVALVAARVAVLGHLGPAVVGLPPPLSIDPAGRIELALATIGVALGRLLLPIRLSVHLDPRDFAGPVAIGAGIVVLVGCGAIARWMWRRSRQRGVAEPALAGIVLLLVMLLPFLHVVPIGSLLADRFLYLPSVGFCVAVATLVLPTPARWRIGVAAVLAIAAAGLTLLRVPAFHDERALWTAAVRADPDAAFPVFRLGELYRDAGLLDSRGADQPGAIAMWTRSLELDPRHEFAALAHVRLGDAAVGRGDWQSATQHYRDAIELAPDAAARAAIEQALARLPAH